MARKDVNIITSLVGAGLEREALLLRDFLATQDIYCVLLHYTNLANTPMVRADINIFLEVVCPPVLNLSRENWLVPNSEWWDAKNDQFLDRFTKILCKTKDCYDIWCRKVGAHKCVYTSFEARDIYRADIPREKKFLHVAGKSEHKNTEAVIRAWRMTRHEQAALPHLTVVARNPKFEEMLQAPFPDNNVVFIPRADDQQLIELMNSHRFHLIPSMYEGFGHVLHEGLSCGAVVITTDAPPMNTYDGVSFKIPVDKVVPRLLAQLNEVSPQEVARLVGIAAQVKDSYGRAVEIDFDKVSEKARRAFRENREFFRGKLMGLVNSVGR